MGTVSIGLPNRIIVRKKEIMVASKADGFVKEWVGLSKQGKKEQGSFFSSQKRRDAL